MKVYLVFAVPCDRYGFVIGDGAPTVVEVLADESSARTARSAYVNTALRVEEWEIGAKVGRVLFDDIERDRLAEKDRVPDLGSTLALALVCALTISRCFGWWGCA